MKQSILTITALLIFVASGSAATIVVNAGGNLQSAINAAAPGDVIVVEAGATFRGPFELPAKTGDAEIVIQSSRVSELPQGRVNPALSPLMPKIVVPNAEQGFRTKPGAHHYRFDGIEVLPESATITLYDLVRLGDGRQAQTTLASVPHHIKIDRCYIHGLPTGNAQRGISLNSSDSEITRSYIADIHWSGTDSQAICGWNTPGRNKIIDNYLEAASENILLGGSDPFSAEFTPTGDQILRNYVFKPLTYKGKGWAVKNLLELKNARNTVIDGNIFENCWTDGQSGIAILFTARNQDGTAPYSVVENATFTNNIVRNAEGGVHVLRTDTESKGAITSNVTVANNVFDKITFSYLTVINNPVNLTVVHNTVFKNGNIASFDSRVEDPKATGLTIRDNLFSEGNYGVHGSGVGEGTAGITKFYASYVFEKNNLAGRDASMYPPNNTFVLTPQVGFVDLTGGNYRLSASSPFKGKATDGKDIGADVDVLIAAQQGTVTGPVTNPSPSPTPTATPLPSPSPSPSPTPVPSPTPQPTPSPTPTPTPSSVCVFSAPDTISVPRWGSKVVTASLSMSPARTGTVSAIAMSGQVTAQPRTPVTVSGTSALIDFQITVKNNSSSVRFDSPCGAKTMQVTVVR